MLTPSELTQGIARIEGLTGRKNDTLEVIDDNQGHFDIQEMSADDWTVSLRLAGVIIEHDDHEELVYLLLDLLRDTKSPHMADRIRGLLGNVGGRFLQHIESLRPGASGYASKP